MKNKGIIAISGTPGTGKTKLTKKLAKKLDYEFIDISELIKKEKLYSHYDRTDKTYVVEIKKVERFLIKKYKKHSKIIVEGHITHLFSTKLIKKVIVLRYNPEKLKTRLKRRKYNKKKINDNYEAELIGLISWEAMQKHKKVYEIDTTDKTQTQIIREIKKVL